MRSECERERGLSSERDAFGETEREKVLDKLRKRMQMLFSTSHPKLFTLSLSYNWKFEANLASDFFIQGMGLSSTERAKRRTYETKQPLRCSRRKRKEEAVNRG